LFGGGGFFIFLSICIPFLVIATKTPKKIEELLIKKIDEEKNYMLYFNESKIKQENYQQAMFMFTDTKFNINGLRYDVNSKKKVISFNLIEEQQYRIKK